MLLPSVAASLAFVRDLPSQMAGRAGPAPWLKPWDDFSERGWSSRDTTSIHGLSTRCATYDLFR